jgi:hypothetical protein
VALSGPYTPLLGLFQTLPVGTFFLEMATPRAGDQEARATCRPRHGLAWASSTRNWTGWSRSRKSPPGQTPPSACSARSACC